MLLNNDRGFKMKIQVLIASLALSIGAAAFAQTTAPASPAKDSTATPNLDKREANQQKRIDQGVASGQLTAKETNRLDKREAKLAADEAAVKADGKLTPAERRKLQREANRDSKAIYKLKHNKQTAAPAGATGK
jgi:Skp family chaperone for outer membrane proteins